jgi:TetR/AcrR family transcriptional repressor of lmrAB and yxaGH operons
MSAKRDEIIATTCELLETQGYHATGLNQIIRESQAPKGSLYHYFPEGKEALAAAAITRSRDQIAANIERALAGGGDPAAAVAGFIRALAGYVAASGYQQGGPITAVALEAASTHDRLRVTCRDAYRAWQELFAAALSEAFGAEPARRLAALIVAAIEGGIILARVEQSERPLLDVADGVERLLQTI